MLNIDDGGLNAQGTDKITFKQLVSGSQHIHQLTRSNDSEILNFFDRVGMASGGFKLLMKRNPKYFDLLDHRGGVSVVCGLRDRALKLAGTGTLTSTPAYIGNKPGHAVYFCDLRVDCPDREVAKEWKAYFGKFLSDTSKLEGIGENAKIFTVIIEGNELARKVLEDKVYNGHKLLPIAPYAMITLFFKNPLRHFSFSFFKKKATSSYKIESSPNLEELEEFLHSVHSKQAFGHRFDAPNFELRRRLKDWKNLSLKDFFVVRNASGKIIASTALLISESLILAVLTVDAVTFIFRLVCAQLSVIDPPKNSSSIPSMPFVILLATAKKQN